MPPRAFLGRYGERVAESWLRAQGFRILYRNFRWGDSGEIDLVCRQGDVLVFTEVKSTTNPAFGAPARAVNRHKRRLLRRGARHWLTLLGKEPPIRFDIVEVYLLPRQVPRVNLIANAFHMHEGGSRKNSGGVDFSAR
ncbi:MAG: YraN family protein [Akkermansia sp.]|nr:YraN family protein [Akkermansia sp.]